MKHFTKLFGIIALALIIGFSFAACSNGSTDGGGGDGGGGSAQLTNTVWVNVTGGVAHTFAFYPYEIGIYSRMGGNNAEQVDFTWSASGNTVTMRAEEGTITGTVSGSTMSVTTFDGTVMTLTKES